MNTTKQSNETRAARKPTIYEAMTAKLGRPATDSELNAECRRIIREVNIDMAGKGKLRFQK